MSIEGLIAALRGFMPLGTFFVLLFAVTTLAPKPDEISGGWWSVLWYIGLIGTSIKVLQIGASWVRSAFALWLSRSARRKAERTRVMQVLAEIEALPSESRRILLAIIADGERFVALDDWDPHVETLMRAGFLVRQGRIGTAGARFEVPFADWQVLRMHIRQLESAELTRSGGTSSHDVLHR